MAAPQNLLQVLQARTIVDCDTMELDVTNLSTFSDCTSNQAIAFGELQKSENEELVRQAVEAAKTLAGVHEGISVLELAVEIAMIKLQLAISKKITGFVHIQTNPYHSYDTQKMIADARRIVSIFKHLDASFDAKRVCIKIPSSWEGLQACKVLEKEGISTLATTLFTIEQAAVAGEVGCHYIAPYVNELKVHFEPGFIDHNKAQALCVQSQRYFEKYGFKTQVLPASLTSTDEIMALAGVHHITISPPLLRALIATPASSNPTISLFDTPAASNFDAVSPLLKLGEDEPAFRIAFTRSQGGEGERKLGQAVNIFCDMQTKLEAMVA